MVFNMSFSWDCFSDYIDLLELKSSILVLPSKINTFICFNFFLDPIPIVNLQLFNYYNVFNTKFTIL